MMEVELYYSPISHTHSFLHNYTVSDPGAIFMNVQSFQISKTLLLIKFFFSKSVHLTECIRGRSVTTPNPMSLYSDISVCI